MSTRALVGLRDSRGWESYVYLHYDGYPSAVLPKLAHYTTPEHVRGLLALGELRILGATPRECSPFYPPDHPDYAPAGPADTGDGTGIEHVYLFSVDTLSWWHKALNPEGAS